jgi:hypothetical protein
VLYYFKNQKKQKSEQKPSPTVTTSECVSPIRRESKLISNVSFLNIHMTTAVVSRTLPSPCEGERVAPKDEEMPKPFTTLPYHLTLPYQI